jgi:hypothetical protein
MLSGCAQMMGASSLCAMCVNALCSFHLDGGTVFVGSGIRYPKLVVERYYATGFQVRLFRATLLVHGMSARF